jgi:hypothetical protein
MGLLARLLGGFRACLAAVSWELGPEKGVWLRPSWIGRDGWITCGERKFAARVHSGWAGQENWSKGCGIFEPPRLPIFRFKVEIDTTGKILRNNFPDFVLSRTARSVLELFDKCLILMGDWEGGKQNNSDRRFMVLCSVVGAMA